jgi:hypothetical protein
MHQANQRREQRLKQRLNHEALVLLEDCTTGYCNYATMQNFSGDGLYCVSDMAIEPGDCVNITIEYRMFIAAPKCYVGEVIWCRELTKDDSAWNYGIGIEIIKAV